MPEASAAEERVLVLAPTGRDASLSCAVLGQAGLDTAVCQDTEALCHQIEAGAGAALVAEEALFRGGVTCMVEALSRQPPWSDFPLVVFAKERESERSSLQMLGNVTLLERPIRTTTLVSAMRTALRARRHQYKVRDLLRQLEEADRRKDEFLAMLGHELRNPLASIYNALQVLDQTGSQQAGAVRQRAIIGRQVRHLSRLVDDLLDVSRITSGKITLDLQTVDLKELAERCLQAYVTAVEAQRKGISLSVKAEPVIVEGDPVRLEQVILNLLSNAVKYTLSGGHVQILVRAERGEAVVRVRDSGIGIAPEMLPRIFEVFAQVEGSLDRSQGGLGLGLTLVRRLVEMHGGSVAATSKGLGHGSEFVVRLPIADCGLGTTAPAGSSLSGPLPDNPQSPIRDPQSLSILIVEDNEDARETLCELLELEGHSVEGAVDGRDGVEKILALRPDAALVDIGLPILDGYQVAQQVRAVPEGRRTFLIALTGYGQPEDRRKALENGFDAHMVKPLDLPELVRVLASLRD